MAQLIIHRAERIVAGSDLRVKPQPFIESKSHTLIAVASRYQFVQMKCADIYSFVSELEYK